MACPTTFTLGGIDLNPNMIWEDRYFSQLVAQSNVRTLAGSLIVYTQGLTSGQEITLVANEEQGWLTLATIQALQALADVPGGIYQLVIDSTTLNVMFRHDDPPAFQAELLIPRLNPESEDYFTATIKLIGVD